MRELKRLRKEYWKLVRQNTKKIRSTPVLRTKQKVEQDVHDIKRPNTLKGYIIAIKSAHKINKYGRQLKRKYRYEQRI